MKMKIRIILLSLGLLAIICVAVMLVCNQIVVNNAEGKAFSEIDSIKYNKVGLLLGTTPQARITKVKNYFFIYRLDAAEQLYRARKIEKILISGDEHSLDGINEPECMRDSLVARGIPAEDIYLDGKGYRTINSVINANKVFGLKSFTIISQEFHNERALYQAEHLGLDVENLQAFNAKMPTSRRAYLTSIREYFARVKMFLDLIICNDADSIDFKVTADVTEADMSQQDSIQRSINELSKDLKTDPGVYELYEKRARQYYDQKKYDLAVEEFQKMIDLEPENVTGYIGKGYILNEQKKWYEAVEIFNDAIKIADDFSFAYSFRAEAFLGLKRWNEATDDLIKAMSLSWDQKALYLINNLQEPALSILISKVNMKHALYPNEEKWQKLLKVLKNRLW